MDLKTPIVPEDKLHANFKALKVPGFFDEEWETLQSWTNGFIDRDGKFVKEFQTTFNSSFWELYLHAAFQELGYESDYSFSSPDFFLSHDLTYPLVAEAVIASHADGYCPEWQRSFEQLVNLPHEEIIHIATIRLANAVWSKFKKFKKNYSKLPHVQGKPFVICAAPFEQPAFFTQNDNAIRKVLYGYDQPLWITDSNGDRIPVGNASINEILKDNGAEIPLGFFSSSIMPEVSAVIFSNTATITKIRALTKHGKVPIFFQAIRYNEHGTTPHQVSKPRSEFSESLLDGLHVCVNPFAKYPLDLSPFLNREIAIHSYDSGTDEYVSTAPDGFLIQHSSMVLASGEDVPKFDTIRTEAEFKRPILPKRNEKELFPVAGHVFTFVDNHLAHYKGWTICVARDVSDNDWLAQATTGLYETLATFQQADKSNHILGKEWCEAKEEAFTEVIGLIDQHLEKKQLDLRQKNRLRKRLENEKKRRRKKRKCQRLSKKKSRQR